MTALLWLAFAWVLLGSLVVVFTPATDTAAAVGRGIATLVNIVVTATILWAALQWGAR